MSENCSPSQPNNHVENNEPTMTKKDETEQELGGNENADDVSLVENVSEKSELDKLKDDISEAKDRYLRLAAEFENYKKISQREQQNGLRFANEAIITNLLPIVDNLEQAVMAQKKISTGSNDILLGVEMVLKQFADVLARFGVENFSAEGAIFDPSRHEALSEQEDDSVPEGTVVNVYQKGYLLHGRLLRPARVVVAKKSGK